jgi:hypothetical protein
MRYHRLLFQVAGLDWNRWLNSLQYAVMHIPSILCRRPSRFFAVSSRRLRDPRFAPTAAAIGLARDAQIRLRINSPKFRDPVKYPG